MDDFEPLFPEDVIRTRQFRQTIIRKTMQLIKEYPDMDESDLLELVEKECVEICDFCVQSASQESSSEDLVKKYFLHEKELQRKDHVGRFFVQKLEAHLQNDVSRKNLYPAFAQSVKDLLGADSYDLFNDRIKVLLAECRELGTNYDGMLETVEAYNLMKEIACAYRKELKKSPYGSLPLKNLIESALIKYQYKNPGDAFDVGTLVEQAFDDFLRALELIYLSDKAED